MVAVQDILTAIEQGQLALPTLPSIAQKILRASHNDQLTSDHLAQLIEHDPAIAAQLVRISNSPLVGRPTHIADLPTAIGLLGVGYCSQLAISLALKQLFRARHDFIKHELESIWQHSNRISALAMTIAKALKVNPGEAYLAGLLQCIGALPLLRWLDKTDTPVENIPNILNLHQAQIGAQLLKIWEFPDELCIIPLIRADLNQQIAPNSTLANIIALALYFLQEGKKEWQPCSVLEQLNINPEDAQKNLMEWYSIAQTGH